MIAHALLRSGSCIPLAVALLGCGSSSGDSSPSAIDLAFIPKASNNLVFAIGNDGAQFAGRDLTSSLGVQVNVEYLASPELDPAVESGFIRQAIAAKKKGLLVSCIDDSLTAPIDEAVEAGIPVITYDSDCPKSKRLGFYSMQSEETGAKGADLLASAMGPGAKAVAILTGRAGADNLDRRVAGFTNRLSTTYPQIGVTTIIHCVETAEACGAAVEDEIIAHHPDLDGLFVVGLWGLQDACLTSETGMTAICEDSRMPKWKAAAKGKLKTVAYDTLPSAIELMNQGYVSALLGQRYFGWGYDTVTLMVEHLTASRVVSPFIDSGFDVVCPSNAAEMSAKWVARDFRAPLTQSCGL
jgi:ribose transport system substrate-binding protein